MMPTSNAGVTNNGNTDQHYTVQSIIKILFKRFFLLNIKFPESYNFVTI